MTSNKHPLVAVAHRSLPNGSFSQHQQKETSTYLHMSESRTSKVETVVSDEAETSKSWSKRLIEHVVRGWRDESVRRRASAGCLLAILAAVGFRKRQSFQRLVLSMIRRPVYATSSMEAPLSFLYRASREGRIEKALIGATGIFFLTPDQKWRKTIVPQQADLQKELIQTLSRTCPDVSALPESLASRLSTPVMAALPFVYLAFLYRMMNRMHDPMGTKPSSRSTTTFADVAGLDHILVEVSEVVDYLRGGDTRAASNDNCLGARAPRAILLHGPPGTGKTLIAQAVAGEAAVDAFGACSASTFVEMYVGRGAARVRQVFGDLRRQARRRAQGWWWWARRGKRKATAILFLDELDALAKTRSQFSSNDEREQTLNQLLTEMDGFDRDNEDVTLIVMAASNRPDTLDPAVLRRFERQVHVDYPTAKGREAILQIHGQRIKCSDTIDWATIAQEKHTIGFSGADIRNLVNEAALLAVREHCEVVQQGHLEHAARRVREMKQHVPSEQTLSIPIMMG